MNILAFDGQQYHLKAMNAARFADGRTEMVSPELSFESAGTHWEIRARTGLLRGEEIMRFREEVTLQQRDEEELLSTLKAEFAEFHFKGKNVRASGGVEMHSSLLNIRSDKLDVSLLGDTAVLSGSVRGEYDAAD